MGITGLLVFPAKDLGEGAFPFSRHHHHVDPRRRPPPPCPSPPSVSLNGAAITTQRVAQHLDHRWLERFLEHRIADRRVLRLIQKWMAAGVIEDGAWTESLEGVPQGASASPLLANVYLHYVFDLCRGSADARHTGGARTAW